MSLLRPAGPDGSDDVQSGTRTVLAVFVGFTLLATLSLLARASDTERYFAWHIAAPVTAAFLGAGYAAGFVLSVLALRQARWSSIRIPVVTVTVFAVLTLIGTLPHLHRMHLTDGGATARFAAWLWLVVYVVIPLACLVVVGRQERSRPRAEAVRSPMPGWLTALLGGQGAVLFTTGAVLFAGGLTRHHHAKEWTGFWPLPLAPISSTTVGAWLLAFGLATALAIWDRDLSRGLVAAVSYAVFGALQLLVLLRYRAALDTGDPWLWFYVALFVTIAATGLYGWWAARRSSDAVHLVAGPGGRAGASSDARA